MTPIDDFAYLLNNLLLGEEPTIEDFILFIGTLVAFIAFILWCCFPIQPKQDIANHRQFNCKTIQGATTAAATSATSPAAAEPNQLNNSYSKSGPSAINPDYEYNVKTNHSYHYCT